MQKQESGSSPSELNEPRAVKPAVTQRLSAGVESAGRLLAIVAVCLYILGLLIVNVYLYQVGISDFAVLRTRFLLTGGLAALGLLLIAMFLVAAGASIATLIEVIQAGGDKKRWRDIDFQTAAGNLFVLVMLIVTVLLTPGKLGVDRRSMLFGEFFPIYEVFIGICMALSTVFSDRMQYIIHRKNRGERSMYSFVLMILGVSVIAIFGLFLYIDYFALNIFPIVPEQFGGGRPRQVNLVTSPRVCK